MRTVLTGYLKPQKARKRGKTNDPHHGDTVITGVTSGRLTGGKISSQPYSSMICMSLHMLLASL